MSRRPDPLRYDPDGTDYGEISSRRVSAGRLIGRLGRRHPARRPGSEERLEARRRRSGERFEARHAALYEKLRAVEHGVAGGAPRAPVEAVPAPKPAPVAGWRRTTRTILGWAPVVAAALLLVALVWRLTGLAAPSWWDPLFLPAAVGGSLGIAWLGVLVARKGRRRVFSERLIGRGSVSARHITGQHPVRLIEGRPAGASTKRPFYEFNLDGGQVVLSDREVAVGGDLRWELKVKALRAWVGDDKGNPSATGRRRGIRRWAISDGVSTSTLELAAARLAKRGLKWSHTRRFRHAVIKTTKPVERSIGAVVLHAERSGEVKGNLIFADGSYWVGEYHGVIDFDEPISLPAAVLALRLTLGRWSKRAPRVGHWRQMAGDAGV